MSESAALVTYSVTEEQIAETKARYAALSCDTPKGYEEVRLAIAEARRPDVEKVRTFAAQLREIAMPTVNDPVLADALLVAWDALGSIADELERAAARRAA